MNPSVTASIPILYQTHDFLIIDKPISMNMHSDKDTLGIVPILCRQLDVEQLWLVHRLDTVTSGLLMLAKNSNAASYLSQLFAGRKIEKYYLALSDQKPKKKQGLVKGDMKKARGGQWMLTKTASNPAITQFFSQGLGNGLRLSLLKPKTGKTHQLRVMLKSLGSPILGDELYKGTLADRTYLHSFALKFTFAGVQYSFAQPPSEGGQFNSIEFSAAIETLMEPWQQPWPKIQVD